MNHSLTILLVTTLAIGLLSAEEPDDSKSIAEISEVYITATNPETGIVRGIWLQWFTDEQGRQAWTSYLTEKDFACSHAVYKRSANLEKCRSLVSLASSAIEEHGKKQLPAGTRIPKTIQDGLFYNLLVVRPQAALEWQVEASSREELPALFQKLIETATGAMPELESFDAFDQPAIPPKSEQDGGGQAATRPESR